MQDHRTYPSRSGMHPLADIIRRFRSALSSADLWTRALRLLTSIALSCSAAGSLQAAAERTITSREAEVCDSAARAAANRTGVPVDILLAITRTETGRTKNGLTEPWPWAVNMEGRSLWFDTQAEAMSYVFDHFRTGARSFDVGCFQINYRWHSAKFSSIEQMFDPYANARYAAEFLRNLFDESGDWRIAAGAFHSRTPALADRYIRRFDAISDEITKTHPGDRVSSRSARHIRQNHFPLLQAGSVSGLGSLVPLASPGMATPVSLNASLGNW